jgi:hypothetical protein
MGSGRKTIEPRHKAHKRADSGVVVGKGARMRSLIEDVGEGCRREVFLAIRVGCSVLELGAISSRASSPTGFCVAHSIDEHPRKSVGAGLLAKASAHSTLMQADPPYSRASPLPQGICGGQGNRIHP